VVADDNEQTNSMLLLHPAGNEQIYITLTLACYYGCMIHETKSRLVQA